MPHLDARALDADPEGLAALAHVLRPSGRPPPRAPAWTPRGLGGAPPTPAWSGGAPVPPVLPPPPEVRPAPGGSARRAG